MLYEVITYTTERSYKYMTYEYNKALYKNEIVEKELITFV